MFIVNDPYNGGGTHLPDIAVASAFTRTRQGSGANDRSTTTTGGRVLPTPLTPTHRRAEGNDPRG